MAELSDRIRKTIPAALAASLLVLACSGGGSGGGGGGGSSGGSSSSSGSSGSSSSSGGAAADTCSSFAGVYDVTTEIVTTDCPLGLHVISQPVTWTFTQAAPSCSFTMTNSLYPGSQYSGSLAMAGTSAKLTWTSVDPAPISGGHALTYTSEDLTITAATATAAGTLWGSFAWSSAYGCTGTTNVCHGSVAGGCASPN